MLHPVGFELQTQSIYPGWDRKHCTAKRVNDLIVDKYSALVNDGNERMKHFKEHPEYASQGFWYKVANFKALQEVDQERLQDFREKGHFYDGFPPVGFDHVKEEESPTGKRVCGYVLKTDTLPSVGVELAKTSFSYIDCHILTQIAFLEALLEVGGTDRFNAYFDPKGKHPLRLDLDIHFTPLSDFLKSVVIESVDDFYKGDKFYYRNVPFYPLRHLCGEAVGHWGYCIEAGADPKLAAFGKPLGFIHDQMLSFLADDFNEEPLPDHSIVTEELEKKVIDDVVDTTMKNTQKSAEELWLMTKKARSMTISKGDIEAIHQKNPKRAGLHPEVTRVDINAIHQHLLPKTKDRKK